MKKIVLITYLCFFLQNISAQNDSIKSPWEIINEYSVSVNRTVVCNYKTRDRVGFGIGIYHTFIPKKRINVTMGLEFNRTSQFIKYEYRGHYANATNITYNLNSLSFPVEVRYNIGNKIRWFFAAGVFFDVTVGGDSRGTITVYSPLDSMSTITSKDFKSKQTNGGILDIGLSCGTGLKIPIYKHELIIKPDFKYGLRSFGNNYDEPLISSRYIRLMIGFRY
jgi:hypothetical protein